MDVIYKASDVIHELNYQIISVMHLQFATSASRWGTCIIHGLRLAASLGEWDLVNSHQVLIKSDFLLMKYNFVTSVTIY
jgi:hypothetical protein